MISSSDKLRNLANLVELYYLPVVACQSNVWFIMPCNGQSIGCIHDNIFTPLYYSLFIFHTYSAINFLNTDCKCELRRLFLRHLTSLEVDIIADVQELCILMLPTTNLSSLDITLYNG